MPIKLSKVKSQSKYHCKRRYLFSSAENKITSPRNDFLSFGRITNISNGNFRTLKPLLASGVMLLLAIFSVILNALPSSASSVSISVTNSEQSFTLLPTADTPAFGKSGAVTAELTTDSASGYTFTVAGPDDNQKLTGTNSNNKIASITSAISENTFSTDSNYNNKWGFLPSKLDSVDNTNYQPGPKYSTPATIDVTSTSNNTANTYTFAIATKVDSTQAKDKYSTTFTLAASANATQYYIGYVEATTTLPSPTTGSTTSTTVTLSDQIPTKFGYVFKGWCSVVTTDGTCSGTTYQPGASYNINENSPITNLYAMWKEALYMQEVGTWGSEVTTGSTVTAVDSRDGKEYTVGRLADGKLWMLDNLAFDGTSGDGTSYIEMNSANTNITGTLTWPSSVIGMTDDDTNPKINVSIKDDVIGTATLTGESTWKYGVLYNYAAASAGTITGSSNSTTASQDICPKGWRLPTGGPSGEYVALDKALGGTGANNQTGTAVTNMRNALHFPLSGRFSGRSLSSQGNYGRSWSSTAYDTTSRYTLYVSASNLRPQSYDDRQVGYSVRCVAP